jgi:hypothetical protein
MTELEIFQAVGEGMERAHMQGLYPAKVLLGPAEWSVFHNPKFMTATQVHEACLKGKREIMGLPVKRMGAPGVAVRASDKFTEPGLGG